VESTPVVIERRWEMLEVVGPSEAAYPTQHLTTDVPNFFGIGSIAAADNVEGPLLESGVRLDAVGWIGDEPGTLVVFDDAINIATDDSTSDSAGGTVAGWLAADKFGNSGEWFHVAKTWNANGSSILYLNGAANATDSRFNQDIDSMRSRGGFLADYVRYDAPLSS
jgi:hypothetical protein